MAETDKIKEVAAAVKAQNILYVIVDKTTNMPFIDNDRAIYIYSCREFADECVDYYAQQMKQWYVGEIPNDKIIPFLGAAFYFAGAETAVVDNGQQYTVLPAEMLVERPDYSKIPEEQVPVTNPEYFGNLLIFLEEYRWQLNYDQKAEALRQKEGLMIKSFCEAKFLVPIQGMHGGTMEKGEQLTIACMTNSEKKSATPVFTDWGEFDKVYDRNEWQCLVVGADELSSLPDENVVINAGSVGFIMSRTMVNQMQEIYKEEFAGKSE